MLCLRRLGRKQASKPTRDQCSRHPPTYAVLLGRGGQHAAGGARSVHIHLDNLPLQYSHMHSSTVSLHYVQAAQAGTAGHCADN
jgi:hypothetical protein